MVPGIAAQARRATGGDPLGALASIGLGLGGLPTGCCIPHATALGGEGDKEGEDLPPCPKSGAATCEPCCEEITTSLTWPVIRRDAEYPEAALGGGAMGVEQELVDSLWARGGGEAFGCRPESGESGGC